MIIRIGLSYAPAGIEKFQRYAEALKLAAAKLEEEIEIIDLNAHPEKIEEIDGILYTGGADIAPERYGKAEERDECEDIEESRDQSEFELFRRAEARALPQLGICRGAQLLNVVYGGTLITDIEHAGGAQHKKIEGQDRRHSVKLDPGTLLRKIVRLGEGEINSAHHQAIDRLGAGLIATAYAEDGTIEAIERAEMKGGPFLLAVQWHPERMNFDEPFAHPIFETFVWEVAAKKVLALRMAKPI
jgi:putative glutamine amidotransferase